jgi:hypothetical protein
VISLVNIFRDFWIIWTSIIKLYSQK